MKIFRSPANDILQFTPKHAMIWLDMEPAPWQFTDDITDAEIIFVMQCWEFNTAQAEAVRQRYRPGQIILFCCLGTTGDGAETDAVIERGLAPWRDITDRFIWVHHNSQQRTYPNAVYYDAIWNRQKLYYTDHTRCDLNDRLWTYESSTAMFELAPLVKNDTPRKWLAPMRIYYDHYRDRPLAGRSLLRSRLQQLLADQPAWTSNPQRGSILPPQECIDPVLRHMMSGRGGTWYPVANWFYEDSYVSIYVESVTKNCGTRTLSEKTFDPLIKGHFVLPFAYPGVIADIRGYGFQLPDWIDYSYDDIADDDLRWDSYVASCRELFKLEMCDLHQHWLRDLPMIEHNRSLFWQRPYDELYPKIAAKIVQLGWDH
jgi:hypothetical protein